ncbi:MAG: hypothetical protein IK032_01860 [Bacteroidales bacterium]|nr:hypothetical protein [Bacteroidales bacterium]
MKKVTFRFSAILTIVSLLSATTFVACVDENNNSGSGSINELPEGTYTGGELGTTFNSSSSAYEDPAPAVVNAGMVSAFKAGEFFFERTITQNTAPFNGLGPLYIRSSCEACHPGYGHGKRMERYRADDWGNGYLLVITDDQDNYLSSLTGMPQTKAVPPFKAPIDEDQIQISWLYASDRWGNQFPDGETYALIYPEVTIPEAAYYVPLQVGGNTIPYSKVRVRLESTIGVYGVGLIDAIPDDSLKAQYQKEASFGVQLNPAMWAGNDWGPSAGYACGSHKHPKRYTYALTRGPLQDAPGANAIWNITNVTHPTKMGHYMTAAYATKASQDPDVQAAFYRYFPQYNLTGNVETDIYNYLMMANIPDSLKVPEMSGNDYTNFMVWHRGLAVPAARNLGDKDVQRGKQLFSEIGCAYCHRPSWTTGDDNFHDPTGFFQEGDSRLPRFPYQKIWPYSDFVQHRLYMKNDIRTGWCRTTPLWGRGLSKICTGASDRLHDCRARTVIEAIMWHGYSAQSDAYESVVKFRNLEKSDRDAIVKFIEAI